MLPHSAAIDTTFNLEKAYSSNTDKILQNSIKSFQKAAKIRNQDGELDEQTLNLLTARRCGVSDEGLFENADEDGLDHRSGCENEKMKKM